MANGTMHVRSRYGGLSIFFHWFMLALIVAAYCTMEFKSVFPKGSPSREALVTWHDMLGLTVFSLVWPRLPAQATSSSVRMR